jgi:hypothetical protein
MELAKGKNVRKKEKGTVPVFPIFLYNKNLKIITPD